MLHSVREGHCLSRGRPLFVSFRHTHTLTQGGTGTECLDFEKKKRKRQNPGGKIEGQIVDLIVLQICS